MIDIEFKKIEIKDKELISSKFKTYCSKSCERTFTNVFLWSPYYDVKYAILEDCLFFKSEHDGIAFTYPAGEPENVKKVIEILEEYAKQLGVEFCLYNLTPEMFITLEEMFPNKFKIEYNRDIADYVYETEKLTTLSGKKLHAKRNHINKFKATYEDWSYESISDANIEECIEMTNQWGILNACHEDKGKVQELGVTIKALKDYQNLGLKGGILRVNGDIVAFTLGEEICNDTFVVHIEKAFAEIQGAYPMINQQFVMHECQNYSYINREEDTGSEGLRKAKLSYRPIFLVEKGVVTLK